MTTTDLAKIGPPDTADIQETVRAVELARTLSTAVECASMNDAWRVLKAKDDAIADHYLEKRRKIKRLIDDELAEEKQVRAGLQHAIAHAAGLITQFTREQDRLTAEAAARAPIELAAAQREAQARAMNEADTLQKAGEELNDPDLLLAAHEAREQATRGLPAPPAVPTAPVLTGSRVDKLFDPVVKDKDAFIAFVFAHPEHKHLLDVVLAGALKKAAQLYQHDLKKVFPGLDVVERDNLRRNSR